MIGGEKKYFTDEKAQVEISPGMPFVQTTANVAMFIGAFAVLLENRRLVWTRGVGIREYL